LHLVRRPPWRGLHPQPAVRPRGLPGRTRHGAPLRDRTAHLSADHSLRHTPHHTPRAMRAATPYTSGPFGPAAEKRLPFGRIPRVEDPRKVRTTMTDIFYSLESEVRSYSRSWSVEFVQASGATQTDASG